MSNPTDLRVIKTRQAIRIALISLLSEKELSDITISELSARAQVNRKTFYRHYRSISDVVTEFENELLSDFSDILKTSNTSIFNIGSVLGEISALISSTNVMMSAVSTALVTYFAATSCRRPIGSVSQ